MRPPRCSWRRRCFNRSTGLCRNRRCNDGAPLGPVDRDRRPAVSARDRLHDREPEAGRAAAAGIVRAGEAFERAREELRREARALVAHAQLDRAVLGRRPRAERCRRRAAGRCRRGCRAPARAGAGRRRPSSFAAVSTSMALPLCGAGAREAARDGVRAAPAATTGSRAAAARPRRCGREPAGPPRAGRCGRPRPRRAQRRLELLARAGPPQRELELRAQERERRPQLVACVGDEASLALEPGLEPLEHRVERLAERRISSSRGRERQPLAGPLADTSSARRRIVSTGRSAAPATK